MQLVLLMIGQSMYLFLFYIHQFNYLSALYTLTIATSFNGQLFEAYFPFMRTLVLRSVLSVLYMPTMLVIPKLPLALYSVHA